MGTGPLLYLVAYQYAKAGGGVAAVLDTTPFAAKRRAVPGLLRGGNTFAKGLWYVAALRARGIVVDERHQAGRGRGQGRRRLGLRSIATRRGRNGDLACDAIAFGFGLSSETQLADLAEIPFAFDPVQQQFLPERDITGRTPVRGVYLAGDGSGIAGADAAELARRARGARPPRGSRP